MHRLVHQLNPDHQQDIMWDYDAIESLIPSEVEAVTERFNSEDYHELLAPLRALVQTDQETGIDYALLTKDGNSNTEAIIHFNPFRNGMTDNMLFRARYLQMAFEGFDIGDVHSNPLDILTLSAPTGSPGFKLERRHRKTMSKGEFEALARRYLLIIKRHGYTSVRIIGFSQGATLAAAVAAHAPSYGIIVTHLAVGEPANVMKRSRLQLGRDFKESSKHLSAAIEAGRINHMIRVTDPDSPIGYMLGLAKMARLNASLLSGLAKATFSNDLNRVLKQDTIITLGWGGINTISPAEAMRKLVITSRSVHNAHYHAIHSVELLGAHHTWADRLNVLATFYAYALLRPSE